MDSFTQDQIQQDESLQKLQEFLVSKYKPDPELIDCILKADGPYPVSEFVVATDDVGHQLVFVKLDLLFQSATQFFFGQIIQVKVEKLHLFDDITEFHTHRVIELPLNYTVNLHLN